MKPVTALGIFLALLCFPLFAADKDLGGGFLDHGPATPVSTHRGMAATQDGAGRDVVLAWLYDHRGGYALLVLDAESGESEQITMPFPSGGDGPFASILSRANKFYTHFGSHFCEFDPARRAFTFHHKSKPQMAMSMTEDDQGVIWSVTYPHSSLVSFDPRTRAFRDFGSLNKENWAQYPRSIAADDQGFIYFALGSTAGQVVLFDPRSARATPLWRPEERTHGYPTLSRDENGKVYALRSVAGKTHWFELYHGEARAIEPPKRLRPRPIIAGSQSLGHTTFPSGKRLSEFDLAERRYSVVDPKTKKTMQRAFDYASEGAHAMGVIAAPDGTICGGTAFPMRFFSYRPQTQEWMRCACYGQWNTVARQGDRVFVGGYGGGFLLEYDPRQSRRATVKGKAECNPRFLTDCAPTINRPHALLAHPNGQTVAMAGTPGYGYTGGGLLLWNRASGERTLLTDADLLPNQSTYAIVALSGDKLLCGSTTSPGTGGEKKATLAELYIFNLLTKKLEWREAVLPGVQTYTALFRGPDGRVFGFADSRQFFVFDPATRKIIHQQDVTPAFGRACSQQGPRVFVESPDGKIYVLFTRGVARLDPTTAKLTLVAKSPVPIAQGGDWLEGRIYFLSGSHLCSCRPAE